MCPSRSSRSATLDCKTRPRSGVNWGLSWALATVIAWVTGCASTTEPVAISDHCEPLTDPIRLHEIDFDGTYTVGLVDGHVLFSYLASSSDTERPWVARAQWFDRDLRAETSVFWLGDSRHAVIPRWTTFGHALFGQPWVVPESDGDLPPIRSHVAIYRLAPGSTEFERTPRELPIVTSFDSRPDFTPVLIGSTSATAGPQALAGASVGHGRPVFVLNAIPASCSHSAFINAARLFVFDAEAVYVNQHGDDPCSVMGSIADHEHDATLVSLSDGGLGVLYRQGALLHYARIGSDLRVLDQPPHLVGSTTRNWLIPGGYQARAAQVDSGPILFTERSEENDTNVCSNLRLVDPDGRNARFAPWQLPCRPPRDRDRFAPWLTAWLAVEPLAAGHAALVWGERTNVAPGLEYVTRLTTEVDWQEGVFLTTIDGQGRRAAEIVRVSAPESTAVVGGVPRTPTSGPFPGDFQVMAASEGDEVVVVWRDLRPDAPGYYGRRYRCSALD